MNRVSQILPILVSFSFATAAHGQASPSEYTSAIRYDDLDRVVGKILPDPDETSALKYAASRITFDPEGRPVKVETGELANWKAEAIEPANWGSDFTVLSSVEAIYDAAGRKIRTVTKGSNDAIVSFTQYSYDVVGRLDCTAVRMDPGQWGSQSDACVPQLSGPDGPDRITRNVYDFNSQLLKIRKAIGTDIQQDYVTYTYTDNGQQETVKDANGNLATLVYDGYDRQVAWRFPSKANGAASAPCNIGSIIEANGVSGPSGNYNSSDDCEKYSYDRNNNRAKLMKRDGSVLTYQYDALNRMTIKTVPSRTGLASTHTRDVYYAYDLRGLQTKARFVSLSGPGVDNAYDGFGRMISSSNHMGSTPLTLTYEYDKNGNRTKVIHPDSKSFLYNYDGLNRLDLVQENGSPPVNLKAYSYNRRGLRSGESDANGVVATSSYVYDLVGRLTDLDRNLSGSSNDVNFDFTYNPTSQMKTRKISNNLYATTAHYNVDRNYTVNGLNQYTSANANPTPVGATKFEYDANGNLTRSGTPDTQNGPLTAENSTSYIYDVENRLVGASGEKTATLTYDPLGRLFETVGDGAATTKRLLYDGDALAAEYNAAGTMLDRYVHGGGVDDPVIWYNGANIGSTTRRHLQNNWQGSIIAIQNSAGSMVQANGYDDYGIPNNTNLGRFQYTGQIWIPELEIYHYKARAYSPTLGRFLQTDPIGYEDQVNLYAYVGNDPVTFVDPTGEERERGEGVANGAIVMQYFARRSAANTPSKRETLARNYRSAFSAFGLRGSVSDVDRHSQESTRRIQKLYKNGKVPSQVQLQKFAKKQGWKKQQSGSDVVIYVDENGTRRLQLKPTAAKKAAGPLSQVPRIQYRDVNNQQIDPVTGEKIKGKAKKGKKAHRPMRPRRR